MAENLHNIASPIVTPARIVDEGFGSCKNLQKPTNAQRNIAVNGRSVVATDAFANIGGQNAKSAMVRAACQWPYFRDVKRHTTMQANQKNGSMPWRAKVRVLW